MTSPRAGRASNFVWSAVEGGAGSVISLLCLVAFSRVLAPTDFGLFATALSLFELLSLLSNLAFHDALVQVPVLTERHKNTAFTITLAVSIVFSALFWLASPTFSLLMHSAKAGPILGVLGIGFVLNGLSATITAQQRRDFHFRTLAIRTLVGRSAGAALGLSAAFFGAGVWSLVLQQLGMAGMASAILWAACDDRPRLALNRREARQLVIFGLGAAGAEFVNAGAKRIFVTACGVLLGPAVAGQINLAFRMVDTLWGVSAMAIYQVVLPIMSRLQDDAARLTQAFRRSQTLTCYALYPIFMALAAAAPRIVVLLFGARWLPASGYMTALCFMMLLQVPRMLSVPILTALGRPRDVLSGYCVGLVYLLLAVAFVPFASAATVIGVWAGTEIVYAPVFAFLLYRGAGIGPLAQLRNIVFPLLAAGALYCGIITVDDLLGKSINGLLALAAAFVGGGVSFLMVVALLDRASIREVIALASNRPGREVAATEGQAGG